MSRSFGEARSQRLFAGSHRGGRDLLMRQAARRCRHFCRRSRDGCGQRHRGRLVVTQSEAKQFAGRCRSQSRAAG